MAVRAEGARDGDTKDFDTGAFMKLAAGPYDEGKELEPEITDTYDVDGWPTSKEIALGYLQERRAAAEQAVQLINFLEALRRGIAKKQPQELDVIGGEGFSPAAASETH